MRNFTIKVDGTEHRIEIDGNSLIIDNIPFVMGQSGGMVTLDGIAYDVNIKDKIATVDGKEYAFEVKGFKSRSGSKKEEKKTSMFVKEGSVTSVMPGGILRILVKEGDKVESGQVLLILEAMKMENEVQAEKAGTVKKILVNVGDKVDEGQSLVEIE